MPVSLSKYSDNQRALLRLIRRSREGVTRAQLSELSGLSVLTITKTVADFLADGLVCEYGTQRSTGGRKASIVGIDPALAYIVSVDIGAAGVTVGLVNAVGEVLLSNRYVPALPGIPAPILTPAELLSVIKPLIEVRGRDHCLGIGIGVSGIVDKPCRRITFCPNILGWNEFDVCDYFEKTLSVPVQLDTSARCMALGEKFYGAGRDSGDMILLSIGYSIAAGIILGGQLVRGTFGSAGEFGHMQVSDEEALCTCGSRGCLELYGTVPVILERYQALSGVPKQGDVYADAARFSLSASSGDVLANTLLKEAAAYIGVAIANTANLLNPERFILTGGLFRAFPSIFTFVSEAARNRCLPSVRDNLTILPAELSGGGPVVGCATMVLNTYFD